MGRWSAYVLKSSLGQFFIRKRKGDWGKKGISKSIEKAKKKAILNGFDKGLSIAMICNINELTEEYVGFEGK